MKLTRLIVALVVMGGVGGVLWWSNKQEAAKEAKPPADTTPKVLSLTGAEIRQVEMDHNDGEKTLLKRNDANLWQIAGPKTVPTDQSSVSTFINALSSISSDRVVDDNVTDLAAYGLSPAAITFKIESKNKNTTLLIGADSPSGSVYAKVDGDPRLFTIAKFTKDSLDKSTKDLRDKRLMTFDTNLVSKIDLDIAKQPPIEFNHVGNLQWKIVKPKELRADGSQVEDFSGRLHEAQMDTAITEEDAKKYATEYASAPLVATVVVTDSSGTQKMEVHKSKDDYLATSSVTDGVTKLTAADLTKFFDKKVDDFRAKKIFDFGFSDPTRFEIKDGAKDLSVQKMGDGWASNGKTMDSVSVQALTDKLRDLSADKLLDSGTFGAPQIDMTVVSDDGKRTEKVQIAPAGKDFLAKRENDPTLYQLSAMAVGDLRTAAGDVKEAPPAPPAKKK